MRSAFKPSRGLVFFLGTLAGLCIAFATKPIYQKAVEEIYHDRFFHLTAECDAAMRVHLVAKNRLDLTPSSEAVTQLRSAELGLLACQDYDMMRKRLIRLGLDENALSELTLRFAEDRAKDLKLVVETHEFRY